MKLVALSLSIIFIFGGCGVETSSSASASQSSIDDIDGTSDDNNSSDDDNASSDDIDDSTDYQGSSSNFDMKDATFDEKACSIENGYNVTQDSSFDPNATPDDDNGLEIESRYAYNTDVEATKVYIFYPDLTQEKISRNVNVYSENYRFGFDEAWIANDTNTVYIRLAKNGAGIYGCYRYELDSLNGESIQSTKVYR